jgi:hypothetical protein
MSVTTGVSLVHWNDFASFVGKRGEVDEFVERFPKVGPTDDTHVRQMDLLDAFDACKAKWPAPARDAFEKFFGTLFWSHRSRSSRMMDISVDERSYDWIESILSPESVRRLASAWHDIRIEQLAAVTRDLPLGPFDGFAAFAAYAKEWGGFVEKAAQAGEGMVICCWA